DRDDADSPLLQLGELVGNGNAVPQSSKIIRWGAPARPMTKDTRGLTYRIAVEDIIACQETLVRSLGRHAPRWPGVCGAAELFDSNVALVLDLQELISSSINAG